MNYWKLPSIQHYSEQTSSITLNIQHYSEHSITLNKQYTINWRSSQRKSFLCSEFPDWLWSKTTDHGRRKTILYVLIFRTNAEVFLNKILCKSANAFVLTHFHYFRTHKMFHVWCLVMFAIFLSKCVETTARSVMLTRQFLGIFRACLDVNKC